MGTFANGRPTGEVTVSIEGGEVKKVASPFDGSEPVAEEPVAAVEPEAAAPVEEEKKEPVEPVAVSAPVEEAPVAQPAPTPAATGKKNNKKKGKGA